MIPRRYGAWSVGTLVSTVSDPAVNSRCKDDLEVIGLYVAGIRDKCFIQHFIPSVLECP